MPTLRTKSGPTFTTKSQTNQRDASPQDMWGHPFLGSLCTCIRWTGGILNILFVAYRHSNGYNVIMDWSKGFLDQWIRVDGKKGG